MRICFLVLVLMGCAQMTSGAMFPIELASAVVERTQETQAMTLEVALREIPKEYGLKPVLMWAINQHESMSNKDPHHFDAGQLSKARKYTTSDYEAKMLASSHGPMHVHGLTARGYGVHWSQLYDPEISVRTACRKMEYCKNTFAKLWDQIACYNGSGPRARAYPKFIVAWLNKPEAKEWMTL